MDAWRNSMACLNALTAELFVAYFLGHIFFYVFVEIDPQCTLHEALLYWCEWRTVLFVNNNAFGQFLLARWLWDESWAQYLDFKVTVT